MTARWDTLTALAAQDSRAAAISRCESDRDASGHVSHGVLLEGQRYKLKDLELDLGKLEAELREKARMEKV